MMNFGAICANAYAADANRVEAFKYREANNAAKKDARNKRK